MATFLFLISCVAPTRADHPLVPGDADDWRTFEVDDIEVVTNSSVGRAIEDVRALRELRDVLGSLLIEGTSENLPPLTLVLFDEREHFEPYQPWYEGDYRQLGGWFMPGLDRNTMVVDASRRRHVRPVVFHEFVHAWIAANLPSLPLWMNEGFAEFYSTFEMDGDTAKVGKPIEWHRDALKQRRFIGFPRMNSLDHDAPEYNESARNTMYYAQSWALVHYWMTTRARRPGLTKFIEAVHRGVHPAIALEECFEVGYEVIEAEMKALKDRKKWPVFSLEVDSKLDEDDVDVRRMSETEILLALGETVARLAASRPGFADAHFEAVLESQVEDVRAYRGLASYRAARQDLGAANEFLDRALAIAPEDRDANVAKGFNLFWLWLRGETASTSDIQGETPPELVTAREHFERVLAVDGDDVFARAGFGLTFLVDLDPREGIDSMARARETLTWENSFLAAEVVMRAHARQTDVARTMLENRLRTRKADRQTMNMIGWVESQVINAEMMVVDRLEEEGDYTQADAILTTAIENAGNTQILRFLRERQASLQRTMTMDPDRAAATDESGR